jgi:hypothetical protein
MIALIVSKTRLRNSRRDIGILLTKLEKEATKELNGVKAPYEK